MRAVGAHPSLSPTLSSTKNQAAVRVLHDIAVLYRSSPTNTAAAHPPPPPPTCTTRLQLGLLRSRLPPTANTHNLSLPPSITQPLALSTTHLHHQAAARVLHDIAVLYRQRRQREDGEPAAIGRKVHKGAEWVPRAPVVHARHDGAQVRVLRLLHLRGWNRAGGGGRGRCLPDMMVHSCMRCARSNRGGGTHGGGASGGAQVYCTGSATLLQAARPASSCEPPNPSWRRPAPAVCGLIHLDSIQLPCARTP